MNTLKSQDRFCREKQVNSPEYPNTLPSVQPRVPTRKSLALLAALTLTAAAQLPPPKPPSPNPWNGTWKLDVARSSPAAAEAGVPQAYRFTLGPSGPAAVPITWEIPELGEVVTGRTDGAPMPIRRTKPTPGLTLAVRTDGPAALTYTVLRNGKNTGGGRMMLVDNGRAWVDLTWPAENGKDRQDLASELIYVKR